MGATTACAMATPVAQPANLIKCRVNVKTKTGEHIYTAIFLGTFDAAIDARERFGIDAKIDVEAVK